MNLLVTYVTHRLPRHLPPHFALVSLSTHLLPLAFSTATASAHTNSLQHHLYPLFKGWGQLCVSPLQGPPLGTEIPEREERLLPLVQQSPHPLSPGLTLSGLVPNVISSSSAGSSIIE